MRRLIVVPVLIPVLLCALEANAGPAQIEKWWLEPQRMLQTNLREIDATMDLDLYVREVKDFGANVVLFNVGGIVANYPTQLEYHYRNPYMKGDLVGTVVKRLHHEGIRVIGRFDFSKINEKFAAEHPEWLYVSEKGKNVNYNGQVHTCVSGGYQQEYMFKILGEAIDRYPLDGVFFNMIGYTKSDYSGNYHGLCQCDVCKRKFREFCGMEMPPTKDETSEAYKRHIEFTRSMSDRQFHRVNAFLKAKRPDLAICTYTLAGVDVIRKESNSALGRGTYHDTDKVKWTLLTCGERQLANTAVHFIAIAYRHSAVSPHLTARRLWQQMINGAWVDFYCIGPLQRQEDRTALPIARDIFRFHAANEQWLKITEGAGQVALVRRGDSEYEGLLAILSENQVAFELTLIESKQLARFPLVVVPDAGGLNRQQCAALDEYVKGGGKLLLTKKVPDDLRCLASAKLVKTRPPEKGAYVRVRPQDRARLGQAELEKLDLLFLRGRFHVYELGKGVAGLLRLIPQDMFGPPEKCYYRHVSDHPALLCAKHGKGAVACFTFGIGTHYEQQGHQGHAWLVLGAVDRLLGLQRRLKVETSPLVEVTHRSGKEGNFEWVGFYNHSGQGGNALHRPIPVRDVHVTLRPAKSVKSVRLLNADRKLDFSSRGDGTISVTIPTVEHYDILLCQYAD